MRLALLAVLTLLLAGCTGQTADTAPEGAAAGPSLAEGAAPFSGGSLSDAEGLPPMRFAAAAFESAVVHEETFTAPNTCMLADCEEQVRRIDVTPQVPADAPVELAVVGESDVCLDLTLEVVDGSMLRYEGGNGGLSATLFRTSAGTVTLLARNCSFLPGSLTANQVVAHFEVRTVVRPETVPTYLPVAVVLAPGDAIVATGDAVEALVVVPPGGRPVHVAQAPFAFNASTQDGAGTYVVVVQGAGDATLTGTNATLRPLAVQVARGTPRPAGSGSPVTWDFEAPGIPLVVGVVVVNDDSGPVGGGAYARSNLDLSVTQGGVELVSASSGGLLPSIGLAGRTQSAYYSAYLDERLAPGTCTASVSYGTQHGMLAFDVVFWVAP